MSIRRNRLPILVLATALAAAVPARAASESWRDLPRAARTAISRSIAADQAAAGGELSAQTIDTILQEAKLGSTGQVSLGQSVAMSGDTIVAGAPLASPAAAYVFVKPVTGWADTTTFTAKLTASDGVTDDGFGSAVAIDGDTIVVGAPQQSIGSKGAAYVFVEPVAGWKSTSAFTAKLTASGGANGDAFGGTVAISENTIFVGAHDAKVGGNAGQGAVFVFEEPAAGWATTSTFAARLTASDAHADAEFGSGLAVLGETVVVGAPALAGSGSAAYVFVRPPSGWATTAAFDAKLTGPDAPQVDGFGLSVAISEDTIVVGAPYTGVFPADNQGAAFVFSKPASGWQTTSAFDAELTASDGARLDFFGSSVAISGRTVAVGASREIDLNETGFAYVFVRPASGWTTTADFDQKLTVPDASNYDGFGSALAISGDVLAVGAPAADGNRGAVYLFGPLPAACEPGRLCVSPVVSPPVVPVGPRP